MRTILAWPIVFSSVALGACFGSTSDSGISVVRAEGAATEDPSAAERQSKLERLAIETLAADLGVSEDRIAIDSIRAIDWRDSSIGCPQPGEAYLQVITPGHRISLRVDGQLHFVHEANGRAFVCRLTKAVGGVTPQRELVFGPQLLEARTDLAARLNVPEAEIRLVSAQSKVWEDASMGCPEPGRHYEPQEVRGYILRLRHHSREFTYHTDLDRTIPCPGITPD